MLVRRILRTHVRIFRAVGLFSIETNSKDLIVNSKAKTFYWMKLLTVNAVTFYGLTKVALQPERFYWTDYSGTANIYRILQMIYTFVMTLAIYLWMRFHSQTSSKVLKEILQMLEKIRYMGLKTSQYNRRSRIFYISYIALMVVFVISMLLLLERITARKVNPDLFTEVLEFFQNMTALMFIECFSSLILALTYCVTCINEELNKFILRQKHHQHLRLGRFYGLLAIFVRVEPVCDEFNRVFGLPVAIIFCGSIGSFLNATMYAYIIFFTDWDIGLRWLTNVSFAASIGLTIPLFVGMVELCVVNAELRREVSYIF